MNLLSTIDTFAAGCFYFYDSKQELAVIVYELVSFFLLQAFEELEDLLAENNICIAIKEKLVKDSGVARESAYDSIVQKLLTKPRARGNVE